jgi:predicted nucleotidyltransferase
MARPEVASDLAQRIDQLRGALIRFGCERAILFGSAVRGDVHEGSDLDVIVVRETELPFVERPRTLLAALPGIAVDVLVYTPEEFERLSRDPRGVIASALVEGIDLVPS